MARIRYIKPDFFKDEDLKELPYVTRLFFAGLWVQSDKEGRGEYRPERLKVEIFPYDKVSINKQMELLLKPKKHSKKPFVLLYREDDGLYWQILEWVKHQKPHHTERNSEIPAFKEDTSITVTSPLNNGSLTPKDVLDTPPKYIRGMGMGMEKGMGSVKDTTPTPKEEKVCFGEYVLLTNEEHKKLLERHGEKVVRKYIERLNNYIGSKGKKYRSHYHTLLTWIQGDIESGKLREDEVARSIYRNSQ